MALTEEYTLSAVTVGATELSIVSGTTSLQNVTTDGICSLFVDPVTNMAKGDEFIVRAYEKVLSGSTKRVVWAQTLKNAQSQLVAFPPLMLMHGWDFTIQKVAGTDRAFSASIRCSRGAGLSEAFTLSAVTIGASEWSVTTNTAGPDADTTHGIYQLFWDPAVATMAKADDFEARIYEKAISSGTQRLLWTSRTMDTQSRNLVSPMLQLKNGWDATLIKIAGTDRAMDASLRRVA
jgi:hypothetical protein